MGEQESLSLQANLPIPLYILEHNFTENLRRKHHRQSQTGNEKQTLKKGWWGGGGLCWGDKLTSSVSVNVLQETGPEVVNKSQ